jgi:phage protein D
MPQAQQDPRFKPARPTINVAGKDEEPLINGLLELLVVETTSGLYRCEARFGNWGKVGEGVGVLYLDRKTLDFGKALQIKIGDDPIFDGKITAIEAHFLEGASPEITVLAEDRLEELRVIRRNRTFADMSDADVIERIAQDHALQADVSVTGPTHKVLAQLNQSDLAFVRERARAVDAEVWVDGSKLYAKPRAQRNGGTVKLKHGKELLEFSVIADLAEQRSSVTVSGWDVSTKQAIKEKIDESAIGGELGSDTSGAKILGKALSKRDETLVHRVPLTSDEARARAEAEFRMRARRFVVGRGRAQPNGKLRVGSYVNLSGLAGLFDGNYYLAEVRHVFDGAKGLRTEFIAERPGIGQAT